MAKVDRSSQAKVAKAGRPFLYMVSARGYEPSSMEPVGAYVEAHGGFDEDLDLEERAKVCQAAEDYYLATLRKALKKNEKGLGVINGVSTFRPMVFGERFAGFLFSSQADLEALDPVMMAISRSLGRVFVRVMEFRRMQFQDYEQGEYESGSINIPDDESYEEIATYDYLALVAAGAIAEQPSLPKQYPKILLQAAMCGDDAVFRMLVKLIGDPCDPAVLAAAVQYANPHSLSWVQESVEAGASLRNTDETGVPILSLACRTPTKASAAIVEALLKAGADPNFAGLRGKELAWPLLEATSQPNDWTAQVVTQLLEAGAKPKVASPDGRTALHRLAEGPVPEAAGSIAELLIRAGVDPNTVANDGTTPLLAAAGASGPGLLSLLGALVAGGAATQEVDYLGEGVFDKVNADNEEALTFLASVVPAGHALLPRLCGQALLNQVKDHVTASRDDIAAVCGYRGAKRFSLFYEALVFELRLQWISAASPTLKKYLHARFGGSSPMLDGDKIYGRQTIRIDVSAPKSTWNEENWDRDRGMDGPYEVGNPHGSKGYWMGYFDYESAMADGNVPPLPDLIRPAYQRELSSDSEGMTLEAFLEACGEHPKELLEVAKPFKKELS